MRPVPSSFLLTLLIALCLLCAWQWHRETGLRYIALKQLEELAQIAAERGEIETRVKAADAEILRLTTALTGLRGNSVSKEVHDEAVIANKQLRDNIETHNSAIKEQNETLAKQNSAMQQANESIRKLAEERDDLAKRLNEVTILYNKRVQEKK